MSDEKLVPQPQSFQIPQGLIDRWINVPERAQITAAFTRQDLDNLFFSITRSNQATFHLQQCLILYSQGKLEDANRAIAESQRLSQEGDNYIRMFMSAIMASAQIIGGKNG